MMMVCGIPIPFIKEDVKHIRVYDCYDMLYIDKLDSLTGSDVCEYGVRLGLTQVATITQTHQKSEDEDHRNEKYAAIVRYLRNCTKEEFTWNRIIGAGSLHYYRKDPFGTIRYDTCTDDSPMYVYTAPNIVGDIPNKLPLIISADGLNWTEYDQTLNHIMQSGIIDQGRMVTMEEYKYRDDGEINMVRTPHSDFHYEFTRWD